jgi:hypothetical protein
LDDFAGDAVGFELLGVKRTFAICEVHDRSYRAGLFDSLVGTSTGDAELGARRVDDEPVVELYRACGALPEWMPQRFMHKELKNLLHEQFDENSNRGLRRALDPFPITEYSFSGLISSIVAEVNQRARDDPEKELEWRQEMLEILWELYTTRNIQGIS